MKKRLTLNTVAEPLRGFPPLSQRCGQGDAPGAAGRPLRGSPGLGRVQSHAAYKTRCDALINNKQKTL